MEATIYVMRGAKAIANALLQNHTLAELNLGANKYMYEGAKAIANALLQNHALTGAGS